MAKRRWFKLGGIQSGSPIGSVYHHIDRGQDTGKTACGIALPEVYAAFWGSPGDRCRGCLAALKKNKSAT